MFAALPHATAALSQIFVPFLKDKRNSEGTSIKFEICCEWCSREAGEVGGTGR